MNCSRKQFGPNFKKLWNFLPEKLPLSSQKYEFGIRDPGSGSGICLFRIPDPGVKKAPDPGYRIRIRNPGLNIWYVPPCSLSCNKKGPYKIMFSKLHKVGFWFQALRYSQRINPAYTCRFEKTIFFSDYCRLSRGPCSLSAMSRSFSVSTIKFVEGQKVIQNSCFKLMIRCGSFKEIERSRLS